MGCSEKDFGNPNTWGIVCNSHSRKVLKRWEQVRPYVEEKGVVYEFFASDGKEEIMTVRHCLFISCFSKDKFLYN